MTDKKCGLFVHSEGNINTAFVLNWFTLALTVFTQGLYEVSDAMRQKLQAHGYPTLKGLDLTWKGKKLGPIASAAPPIPDFCP